MKENIPGSIGSELDLTQQQIILYFSNLVVFFVFLSQKTRIDLVMVTISALW